MAVLSCERAQGTYDGMPIPGLETEFDEPWNVECDGITDTLASIYATGLLPAKFTPHPDNILATVRRISGRREIKRPKRWQFIVHYNSTPLTEEEEQEAIPALDRAAYIDWEATPYSRPVLWGVRTVAGVDKLYPIVNSANDFPDPVPEETDYWWVAHVVKNLPGIPDWIDDGYMGAVNDGPFVIEGRTVPDQHARIIGGRLSRKMKENSIEYRQLGLSIEFRVKREPRYAGEADIPPPFDLELPDMGLHLFDPILKERRKFMTNDSPPRPVSQPIPMDGGGDKLVDPTPENIVLLPAWRTKRKRDFTVIAFT